MKRDCPKTTVQTNLTEVPRPSLIITQGKLNDVSSKDVLLDSGANLTLVRTNLIPEEKKLPQYITSITSAGEYVQLDLEVGDYRDTLRVGMQDHAPHEVIVGMDFKALIVDYHHQTKTRLTATVETRAQKRQREAQPAVEVNTEPRIHPDPKMSDEQDIEPDGEEDFDVLLEPTTPGEGVGSPMDQRSPKGSTADALEPSSQLPTREDIEPDGEDFDWNQSPLGKECPSPEDSGGW